MSFCVFIRNKATNCKSDLKLELTYTLDNGYFLCSLNRSINSGMIT